MRGRRARLILVMGLSVLCTVTGCQRALLSAKDERTPFDRYDAVREQRVPQYVEDEFGRRRPNLRPRLTPRD